MKKFIMKSVVIPFQLFFCVFILSSCSSDDYINVIPRNSTAVVAIDSKKIFGESAQTQQLIFIEDLLKISELNNCGLDIDSKFYIFETIDGNLGMVIKVDDEENLKSCLNALSKAGYCSGLTMRRGLNFTLIKDVWMVGFSSDALLIMGPVLSSDQANVQRKMIKYLEQEKDNSIRVMPMFQKLDSLNSTISVVAKAIAFPEKIVAPFVICAPKGADASDIIISAQIDKINNGCIGIKGESFSFNKKLDSIMKENKNKFRKIKGKYLDRMSSETGCGLFVNVNGNDFLDLLRSNNYFQLLLAGINAAVDIDNIIRSIDGDMAIYINSFDEGEIFPMMCAELYNKNFLNDIDYWKKSCLHGYRLTDCGNDIYCYSNGNKNFYFGVSNNMDFLSGKTFQDAQDSIPGFKNNYVPEYIRNKILGKSVCFILNVDALIGDKQNSRKILNLIKPVFGDIKTVIYSM